ncbi:hypothetical protein T440DRAFT_265567 [Plenodomus tracheiphilus IPT5]|uniref:Uncharacterized protein n=1 Tax=Plenodomus tracheiphilus IPT5 TaxID=1408161 RepID=A0A6A7AQH5_9PLEO|nr:hypothetical protein T440DRAFT_265567 [Plenodomus tracheiphilus IPT5]
MRLFRKRNENSDLYMYQELVGSDQEAAADSQASKPLYPYHSRQCSTTREPQETVSAIPKTHTYTDHNTQTSATPPPCYFTLKSVPHGIKSTNSGPALDSGDVELQVIAHDHVHRYPPPPPSSSSRRPTKRAQRSSKN